MKVTTEIRDDHQALLTLELPTQALERAKRRIAREYSRRMKIPGFRPGKAPYEIVVRKVGEKTIEGEAIDALLDEYYPQALQEAGIKPYAAGKVEEIVSLDPPTFKLLVPLAPDVELGNYREIRLPYEPPEVDEKDIENALNAYREMFAVLEPVERPAEVGDVVYVNVEAYEAGQEEGEPLFVDQNHPVLIEKEPHDGEWPYPGFPEEFVGAQVGDTKTLTYTYPEDDDDEDLRGKTVVVKAEVTEIKARALPELNDEFAQQFGEYETIDQLRDALRAQYGEAQRSKYDNEYLEKALDAIIAQAEIKYPPQMLEEEIEERLKEYQRQAERQGMTWEAFLEARGTDEDALREELRAEAELAVKRRLVLSAIADDAQLSVDEDAVIEATRQQLGQMLAYMDPKDARRLARDQRFVQDMLQAVALDELMSKAQQYVIALAKGELEAAETEAEAAAEETAEAAAADEAAAETAAAPADAAAESETASADEPAAPAEAASQPEAAEAPAEAAASADDGDA